MASQAAIAEYQAEAEEFAAELRESGEEAVFLREAESALPGDASGDPVEVGRAHVFPSQSRADFSGDVRADDRMYFVTADVDVEACSKMRLGGQTFSIGKPVETFDPAGVAIYYEIRVNR